MKKMNKKGFTIVELVIVIAVIAILAAVLIPTFSGVIAKANYSSAQQLAMNGVKAGLLMTNTATLPEDTIIYVASNKKDIDYGFKYSGNELQDYTLKDNDAFITTTTAQATAILISDKNISGTTDKTASDLLKTFITSGYGLAANTEFTVTDSTISWGTGESEKTINYFTSVDLPENVILFVKMG